MRTWQEIISLRNFRIFVLVVAGLFLLSLPFWASQFVSYLMLTFFAYAITVIGFNLLFGYTGLLSFGHALFMAVGAYTAAFLTSKFSVFYMEIILVVAVIVGLNPGCVDRSHLCPLYQNLLCDAHPCLRNALLHLLVKVLLFDRRG